MSRATFFSPGFFSPFVLVSQQGMARHHHLLSANHVNRPSPHPFSVNIGNQTFTFNKGISGGVSIFATSQNMLRSGGWGMSGMSPWYGNSMYTSGGYGGGYGSMMGYGGGGGGGAPSPQPQLVVSPPPQKAEEPANLFDAVGLPSTDGHLNWPLGLRALPPGPETQELRRQVEALLQLAMAERSAGETDTRTAQEANRAVRKLRDLLSTRGIDTMASQTVAEASGFLNKIDDALQLLH
jgi:hypothetical protein